jgi:hypothetical protein
MHNPIIRVDDFVRDIRTGKVGRVLRVKGNMVEIKFPDKRGTRIISSSLLERLI